MSASGSPHRLMGASSLFQSLKWLWRQRNCATW